MPKNRSVIDKIANEYQKYIADMPAAYCKENRYLFMYSPAVRKICFLEGKYADKEDMAEHIGIIYRNDNIFGHETQKEHRAVRAENRMRNDDRVIGEEGILTAKMADCILWGLDDFQNDYPHSEYASFHKLIKENPQYDRKILEIDYIILYLNHPYLEQLMKAGLEMIIVSFLSSMREEKYWMRDSIAWQLERFEKTFKAGKNLRTICSLKKHFWQNIERYRDKFDYVYQLNLMIHRFNLDESHLSKLMKLSDECSSISMLRDFCRILDMKGEEGPYYSFDTLYNYIERMPVRQGMTPYEAVVVLKDYMTMCRETGTQPKIKSTDLCKDHDLMVQIRNRQQNEERAERLQQGISIQNRKLSQYKFEDERLEVIVPQTLEDFINEGVNNRNCVASYGEDFAEGRSNIFFIRKKENPEKSYITVELDDGLNIRQAFYSGNREIRQKDDLDFLASWLDYCKSGPDKRTA